LIDTIAVFLLGSWIFAGQAASFLGGILLVTRQAMQALVSLPPPPGIIWHHPGFPSLLVTYSVSNGFFFSGHTAIAVLARRNWRVCTSRGSRFYAFCLVLLEVAAVLVLRAHYTMDVFAGALAADVWRNCAEGFGPWLARADERHSWPVLASISCADVNGTAV
jgi:hypothetical protein